MQPFYRGFRKTFDSFLIVNSCSREEMEFLGREFPTHPISG